MSSRIRDIEYLDSKINNLKKEQNEVAIVFESFKKELNDEVREMMAEAGILDKIKEIEVKIEEKRIQDQKIIDHLAGEIDTFKNMKQFLSDREAEEKRFNSALESRQFGNKSL